MPTTAEVPPALEETAAIKLEFLDRPTNSEPIQIVNSGETDYSRNNLSDLMLRVARYGAVQGKGDGYSMRPA